MCSSGGKMMAKAELLKAPTKEIKLSSWGIPIAKAPVKKTYLLNSTEKNDILHLILLLLDWKTSLC